MNESPTSTTQQLTDLLESNGIVLRLSEPFFNPETKQFDYKAVLVNTKTNFSFVLDYHTGSAWILVSKDFYGDRLVSKLEKVSGAHIAYNKSSKLVVIVNNTIYEHCKWKPELPTLADVVYSLVLDSSALEETFEDWCRSFGYDTDSRKAENTYNLCHANGKNVTKLLGDLLPQVIELSQDL